ncbi:hypothetical protein EB061_01855 [bacterium]|jgi:hypothetical protein|nr:hypothetical protein [bacterium]
MIGAMRSKWGPKLIGGVIAVIAFVFIFYGIFVPGSGSTGPGVAGEVNGEPIPYTEFNKARNQQIEYMKGMLGGKISEAQLEQFHIGENVFKDLVQRKLLAQKAKKEGFYPSAEQIREQIVKMDVFQKDGRFDKVLYKNVLSANQLNPVRFEELMGQEIMSQNFKAFLGQLAPVSPEEVDQELRSTRDRHKYRYVYLDHESVRKMLPADLKEEERATKLDQKVVELEQKVIPMLTRGDDAAIQAVLLAAKLKVKTSDWLTAQSNIIPGVGSVRSVQDDLFALKKGEPAKSFSLMGGSLLAVALETDSANLSKVPAKDRVAAAGKVQSEKQMDLLRRMISDWTKSSKIVRNDKIVTGGKAESIPLTLDD